MFPLRHLSALELREKRYCELDYKFGHIIEQIPLVPGSMKLSRDEKVLADLGKIPMRYYDRVRLKSLTRREQKNTTNHDLKFDIFIQKYL